MIALLLALAAAAPSPTPAASPAQDVAEVSNAVCLKWASGELALPDPAKPEYPAALAGLGLKAGIDNSAMEMVVPGLGMISRAAMASRVNGASRVVMAVDGAMPGCRVILLGEPAPASVEEVAAALVRPGSGGWTAFPKMTETRGPVSRRVFLRRDSSGKPYLLNLIALVQPIGKIQLYTNIAAVPPNVTLPEGF